MSKRLTTEQFIKKANIIHNNKYNYSLSIYKQNKQKIKIICPKHGIFEQTPNNHISKANKNGCPKCKNDLIIQKHTLKLNEFIQKAKHIHGNKYDYSLTIYKSIYTKIKIICPKHGIFNQVAHDHLKGRGCSKCKSSKGELNIEQHLKKHNIKFIYQKKFFNCKNKLPLPFDFYLPDYNTCIEYDGEQHFKPIDFSFGKLNTDQTLKQFIKTKHNDNIKTNYCLQNNIKLIRIPYTEIKNVNTILDSIFKV